MNNKTLSEKMGRREKFAIIGVVFGICMVLGSWGYYFYLKQKTYESTEQNLVSILKDRSERIFSVFDHFVVQGQLRAAEPKIIEAFTTLGSLKPAELTSPTYQRYAENLRIFLQEKSTESSFNNSCLVSPQGIVLFSDWAPAYVGKDLDRKPYSQYNLAQSCMRARITLTTDISDFAYDPFLKRTTLYITIPILNQDKFLGLLVQKLSRERLFEISDDYIGLGITGDLVLGKKMEEGVLLISRSRIAKNEPLKKFIARSENSEEIYPLIYGASGYNGSGFSWDLAHKKALASWRFLTEVNWGIIVTIAQQEILDSLFAVRLMSFLIMLVFFLLFFILNYFFAWRQRFFRYIYPYVIHPAFRWSLLIILMTFTALNIYFVIRDAYNNKEKITLIAQEKVHAAVEKIEHILRTLETAAQDLAYDLGAQRLDKDDIFTRVKRELKLHPEIYGITIAYEPYAYSPEKRLYAPYVKRTETDYEIEYLEESYDYTKQFVAPQGLEAETQSWYAEPIKQRGIVRFDPYINLLPEKKLLGMFSVPFYGAQDKKKEHALGVVNVVFDMVAINKIVERLTLGSSGYAYLAGQTGALISYPIENYVINQKTIQEIAGLKGSSGLSIMTKNALEGKTGYGPYEDKTLHYRVWAYYSVVPSTQWPIFLVFAQQELEISSSLLRHYLIWLLIIIAAMLFVLLWILAPYSFIQRWYMQLLTAIGFFILVALFIIIRSTMVIEVHQNERETIITNEVALNKYVYEADLYAQYINDPTPIKVPFGLSLTSIDFVNPATLEVSGYVWLKYPEKMPVNARREPQFPQAVRAVTLKKTYEARENSMIVMGWQFTAQLAQDFNFSGYPLDLLSLRIDVEYPDDSKNIMFVPALDDYKNVLPEKMPGTYFNTVIPGFRTIKSYFSFYKEESETNLGLAAYEATSEGNYLSYNLIVERRLLYELIVFILPLFIILLLLYALAWVAEKDWLPIMIVSGYSGLLFSTILLHRALRDQFPTAGILYLEYIFFMIYFTIVPLVFYVLYKLYFYHGQSRINTFFVAYKTYFWLIQMAVLFGITTILFYSA